MAEIEVVPVPPNGRWFWLRKKRSCSFWWAFVSTTLLLIIVIGGIWPKTPLFGAVTRKLVAVPEPNAIVDQSAIDRAVADKQALLDKQIELTSAANQRADANRDELARVSQQLLAKDKEIGELRKRPVATARRTAPRANQTPAGGFINDVGGQSVPYVPDRPR